MISPRSAIPLALGGLLIVVGAAPVAADPGLVNGDYRVRVDGSEWGVWTFTLDCAAEADGCTAQIDTGPNGWSAVATLAAGRWSLTRTSATLFSCRDGSSSPGELRADWNADSLSGSMLLVPEGKRCGGSDAPLRGSLRLIRI